MKRFASVLALGTVLVVAAVSQASAAGLRPDDRAAHGPAVAVSETTPAVTRPDDRAWRGVGVVPETLAPALPTADTDGFTGPTLASAPLPQASWRSSPEAPRSPSVASASRPPDHRPDGPGRASRPRCWAARVTAAPRPRLHPTRPLAEAIMNAPAAPDRLARPCPAAEQHHPEAAPSTGAARARRKYTFHPSALQAGRGTPVRHIVSWHPHPRWRRCARGTPDPRLGCRCSTHDGRYTLGTEPCSGSQWRSKSNSLTVPCCSSPDRPVSRYSTGEARRRSLRRMCRLDPGEPTPWIRQRQQQSGR